MTSRRGADPFSSDGSLPQGAEKVEAVRAMFDAIAPRYDLVNRVMTFRLDGRWRRRAVSALSLPPGARVLDLASGTGDLCVELDRQGYEPVSIDLSFGMLAADHSGAPRVQADVTRLPLPDRVADGVTCGFALRNLVELRPFFAELARVLRPGGRIALLDVAVPPNSAAATGARRLLRQGGALGGRAPVRPRGLPVPPPLGGLPAGTRADAGRSARGRFRVRPAGAPHRGDHPAPHRDASVRAVTRPLERDVELTGIARSDGFLFAREGVGLAGRGVALRTTVVDVADALAEIERDDDVRVPGTGPMAFGALPFQPAAIGEVVVPAVVVGKAADGTRWITSIDGAEADLASPSSPRPSAGAFALRPGFDPERFKAAVVTGRDAVRAGRLTKVVLARDIIVEADRPLDVHAILLRLRAAFATSYRFSVDGFVGASPELLVARHGDVVRSHPLAGTAPRTGDPNTDAAHGGGAHRVHQGPGRASGRHRSRARHPPALVLVPGLGGRAVDRDRGQRPAPGDSRRGAAVVAGSERARARRAPCNPRRRWAVIRRPPRWR